MIIDFLLEFTKAAGQKLTAAADSEYRLDFAQKAPTTGRDHGRPVAVFTVKEAVAGTLTISLQDCDTEGGSYADCASSATLTAPAVGTQVVIPLPNRHKRFMKARFGGAPTSGVVHGFITSGDQDNVPFEQAQSIHTAS